ncbi:hypothetical protein ACFFGH_12045 [Lysobacter korlensis]|uniref:Lipoprotein n=1 Tax=Lysobacter korlensis TaxID=553636 RepID=A0ABV6RP40_9GAMM
MKSRYLLAAVAAAVLSLTGCVMAPGSGVTPDEARERFIGILDSTQEALGGSWENVDDPTARNCTIPLWVDGVRYPGLRLGEAPESPMHALRTVEDHWDALEVSSERTKVGEVTELRGTNPSGDLFIFRANQAAMTLQGESECRPKA